LKSQMRSRFTYANVASSLALFLAVSGGTAIAAATIGSSDIKSHAVTGSKIASNAVTGSKVKNGSLTASDFGGSLPSGPQGATGATGAAGPAGAAATNLWGVVGSNAKLIQGNGIVAVGVLGPGAYLVQFNQNVNNCSAQATVGGWNQGGSGESVTGGQASVQPSGNATATAATQITVFTRDTGGGSSSLPFHIAVIC